MTSVRGRVRDSGGVPVAGAALTIVDTGGRQIARGVTEDDGAFLLAVPGRGSYVLIASAAAHQPEAVTVTVTDGQARLEIALRGARGLRGVVRAATTGVPLTDAAVTLTGPHGDVVASRLTGPGGDYTFASLPAGTYTLAVSALNYRPAALSASVGETSPTTQDVDLDESAVIRGSVRLPEGERPVVTVSLLDDAGQVVRTTTAEETGRYAFHDLDPGSYTVVAASYAPARQAVRITGGRARLDFQLA